MKKTCRMLGTILAILIVVAYPVSASSKSQEMDIDAVLASLKTNYKIDPEVIECLYKVERRFTIKEDTITPLCEGSAFEWHKNGDFNSEPMLAKTKLFKGKQEYIADAVDSFGNIVGVATFVSLDAEWGCLTSGNTIQTEQPLIWKRTKK